MTVATTIGVMKEIGFKWEASTIGIKFENGFWNVNVMLFNDDGSKKPAYGFLKYDSVDDAVAAKIEMGGK
jgi:hypothetical protein